MDNQYISTRIINDVAPIMKKHGYKNFINPEAFLFMCKLFYEKTLNNIKFKEIVATELEECNKITSPEEKERQDALFLDEAAKYSKQYGRN